MDRTYLAIERSTGAVHYAGTDRFEVTDMIEHQEDRYRVESIPAPVGQEPHTLITRPHCPECQEETREIRAGDEAARRGGRSAHMDGEPLCPVMTSRGYRPADHPDAQQPQR